MGAHAVAAFDGGTLIAAGLVAPDPCRPQTWRIRGMATEEPERGRGAGSSVLASLVAYAHAAGAQAVWCHARTPAISLYSRAGFRIVSGEFELPGIGAHVRMELSSVAEAGSIANRCDAVRGG